MTDICAAFSSSVLEEPASAKISVTDNRENVHTFDENSGCPLTSFTESNAAAFLNIFALFMAPAVPASQCDIRWVEFQPFKIIPKLKKQMTKTMKKLQTAQD